MIKLGFQYDEPLTVMLMKMITIFLCVWINVVFVWELSDNNVATIPLLLDSSQTCISYQCKIVIIGKLLVTVMMVGKLLVTPIFAVTTLDHAELSGT